MLKNKKANQPKDASHGEVVMYQTEDGRTALDVRLGGDTVWLTESDV